MILVDGGIPQVVVSASSPLITIKVIGHSGKKLALRTFDIINNSKIGEIIEDITSDEQEFSEVLPTPTIDTDTIINVVITVEDSDGNVYEALNSYMYFMPDFNSEPIQDDAEVWYVTKMGLVFKKRYPKQNGLVVYTNVPVSKSSLTYTVIHQKGKLIMYEGANKLIDVEGKSALIKMTFRIDKELARYLANYIDDEGIMKVIYKAPELAPSVGGFRAIETLYSSRRFTPLAISIRQDTNNVYYDVLTHVELYSPLDIWDILKIVGGALAIVGGAALLVLSAGASAPVSAVMIAGGIGAISSGAIVIYESLTEAPEDIMKKAENTINKAKEDIETTYNDLVQYLDQLVNEGKITEEEKQAILSYVDRIKERSYKAFDELKELVDEAYKRGYQDAVKNMLPILGIAALGGGALGYTLGRK